MNTNMPWSNVEVKPQAGQVWSGKSFASAIRGDAHASSEKPRDPIGGQIFQMIPQMPMPKFNHKLNTDIASHVSLFPQFGPKKNFNLAPLIGPKS